jgi:hypothetical protein
MVELGLKLEDRLRRKGKANISKAVSESNIRRSGKNADFPTLQNSANMESSSDNTSESRNEKVETRKEIANFATTSHDTVDKVSENTLIKKE